MPPLWTASFVRITAIQFLTFAAFQLVTPVLPLYMGLFTSSETVIGSAVGVFTLSAVAARLWMGVLIDRSGRAAVLVYGLAVFALTSALYAATWSVASVMLVRLLHGAAFGAATTAVGAMAADVIPPARRAEGMGLFGTSVNLAQTVAPVLGFALVGLWGYSPTFLSGGVIAVLGLILARGQPETRVLEPAAGPAAGAPATRPPATGTPAPRAPGVPARIALEPGALIPSLLMFAVAMAFGGVMALIPLYAEELAIPNPGILFTLLALAILTVRLFAGRLADRWGAVPLTSSGLVLAAAALYLIGTRPDAFAVAGLPGGLLLGVLLYGFGHGSATPVAQGVSIARVPRARWGAASATFFSFLDLGIGAGAAALGAVAEAVGLAAMYRVAAGLPLLGLVVLLATRRHWTLVGEPEAGSTARAPASCPGATS